MGKTFNLDLQNPAENMLGGGVPPAGGRMEARGADMPEAEQSAPKTAPKTAGAGKRTARAAKIHAGSPAVQAAAEAVAPAVQEEDVAKAWERAGRPKPPAGHVLNRAFVETKSKRLQVLMQPSVYERVHAQAEASGVSVNEMISRLIVAGLESVEE